MKDNAWFSQSTLLDDLTPEPEQKRTFSSLCPQTDPLDLSLRGALRQLRSNTTCTFFFRGSEKEKILRMVTGRFKKLTIHVCLPLLREERK